MQYWPRKRARRIYARVGSWDSKNVKGVGFLGFPGYKVGMTHVCVVDNFSHSLSKGTEISYPVTILECPPVVVLSIRFFKKDEFDNLQVVKEVVANVKDKHLLRKIPLVKKKLKSVPIDDLKKFVEEENIEDIRVKVYTKPYLTTIGKKKPEILEIGLSGDVSEKLEFSYEKLGKEVKVSEVISSGELVDVHGVTKGKGFQGAVKRFGVKLTQHKSEKKRRHAGNVGAWTPSRVLPSVPLPGQMGYHLRTEFNKWVLKIDSNGDLINPKGGFKHYGLIKNEFVLLKGSVMGPSKRLITMVKAIRPNPKYPKVAPEITYIHK